MIFEFIVIFILLFIIVGLVYQFLYDIYLWVSIGSLVFYIGYVTIKVLRQKRRKAMASEVPQEAPKEMKKTNGNGKDTELDTLKEFIARNLREGFQKQIIKDALLKQGWSDAKIEQAFAAVRK